eukprot:m.318027 g.318027  ORF g.318027 m.318027 type:complete len:56 (+) comp615085_c0_seq1:62-229(+)
MCVCVGEEHIECVVKAESVSMFSFTFAVSHPLTLPWSVSLFLPLLLSTLCLLPRL